MAEHNGYNPDGAAGGPGWKVWMSCIPYARVLIAAMGDPTQAPHPTELITGRVREVLHKPIDGAWLAINGTPLCEQEARAVLAGLGAGHRVEINLG